MPKKFDTFRVCPGCGQMISTSRSVCDCGYVLKQSKFRITGSVDAQFLSVVFFVLLLVCFFNSIGTERDLENATYEIESLNHTIVNLEDEISSLQYDYDELLYEYESLSEFNDFDNGYSYGYDDGYIDGYQTAQEEFNPFLKNSLSSWEDMKQRNLSSPPNLLD